jgi:hypothetical protein
MVEKIPFCQDFHRLIDDVPNNSKVTLHVVKSKPSNLSAGNP